MGALAAGLDDPAGDAADDPAGDGAGNDTYAVDGDPLGPLVGLVETPQPSTEMATTSARAAEP